MDQTILVESDIRRGERLVEQLDKTEFQPQAAFWLYRPEPGQWRLILSSPFVQQNGPIASYTLIQSALDSLDPQDRLDLADIGILNPDDHLVRALGLAIGTSPGISEIRFSGNTISGIYVQDAYIYRMTRPPASGSTRKTEATPRPSRHR